MMTIEKKMGHWSSAGLWAGVKPLLLAWFLFLTPISFAQSNSCSLVGPAKSANQFRERSDECELASAIRNLKRLDEHVLVYHSLGEFEEQQTLARVSFEEFSRELREVMAAVGPILNDSPDSKLKWAIINALCSYRDGVFWWSKIHRSRVVNAAALSFFDVTRTPSDVDQHATLPYLVAIHLRQANKYLKQAEALIGNKNYR